MAHREVADEVQAGGVGRRHTAEQSPQQTLLTWRKGVCGVVLRPRPGSFVPRKPTYERTAETRENPESHFA